MNALRNIVVAIAITASSCFAQSLVSASCDPGSDVVFRWTDSEGHEHQEIWRDSNRDGKVETSVPKGSTVTITKYSDRRLLTYDVTAN